MEAVKWSVELNEQQLKEKQELAAKLKQHPLVQKFLQLGRPLSLPFSSMD